MTTTFPKVQGGWGLGISPLWGLETLPRSAPFCSLGVLQTLPHIVPWWAPLLLPASLYCIILGVSRHAPLVSAPLPPKSLTVSGGTGLSPSWLHAFLCEGEGVYRMGSLVKK